MFLILLITAAFIYSQVHGMRTWQDFYDLGALNGFLVYEHGEWWRIFTVMLLHGSFMHYAFNTFFGLFVLGSALERLIGPVKYTLVFVIGGMLASVAVVAWDIMTGNQVFTVGASGAVFAVLGVLLFMVINHGEIFSPRDASSIKGLVLINVIFTFLGGNISIPGHIGGLVAGYLIAMILSGSSKLFRYQSSGFGNPFEQTYQDPGSLDDIDEVDYVDDDEDPFSKYDDYTQ